MDSWYWSPPKTFFILYFVFSIGYGICILCESLCVRVVGACTCTRSVFRSEIEGKWEAVHAVHGLPQVSSFLLCLWICLVLSCLCPCPCFFFGGGGWCELVCVCSRERGGFLFGVGWVFLLFINTWVWCHVQVCVQLHDELICISMPAWLYFFIFHSYWGSPLLRSLWWLFSGCFCWALFIFCLSFLLPYFAGSRLQLPFVRPITALRSGGFQTTSVWLSLQVVIKAYQIHIHDCIWYLYLIFSE